MAGMSTDTVFDGNACRLASVAVADKHHREAGSIGPFSARSDDAQLENNTVLTKKDRLVRGNVPGWPDGAIRAG